MKNCPSCQQPMQNRFFCRECLCVLTCPNPNCNAANDDHKRTTCATCGLVFEDYIKFRKRYKMCPKCKKKQGLFENPCRHCRRWFHCPECGHGIDSSSVLSCPKCGRGLR